jgi:hypothetical protein
MLPFATRSSTRPVNASVSFPYGWKIWRFKRRRNGSSSFRERLFARWAMNMEDEMKKYLLAAALVGAITAPALAAEVGGPVGAGVTVGQTHDHDRTVIKERAPTDRKTVIKKEDENGNREKTVIHHE